jgi:hypothetical protein
MHAGFAGDMDATASAASGVDRLMTEPEECAGWHMHTGFASAAHAAASATASGSTGAGVGTETTAALRFGWGA